MNRRSTNRTGYTLLEMIAVATILSIVGLVAALVIVESMKIYARTVPTIQAEYQARLATERMKRDIRGMSDGATVSAIDPAGLEFVDASGQTVTFKHSGGNLYRNDDLLAQDLSSFALRYWTDEGLPATTPAELHLVEIQLVARVGKSEFHAETVVFPRCQSK